MWRLSSICPESGLHLSCICLAFVLHLSGICPVSILCPTSVLHSTCSSLTSPLHLSCICLVSNSTLSAACRMTKQPSGAAPMFAWNPQRRRVNSQTPHGGRSDSGPHVTRGPGTGSRGPLNVRNFPCQTLKISMVSLVVMGS
jgi:hypothetical protein